MRSRISRRLQFGVIDRRRLNRFRNSRTNQHIETLVFRPRVTQFVHPNNAAVIPHAVHNAPALRAFRANCGFLSSVLGGSTRSLAPSVLMDGNTDAVYVTEVDLLAALTTYIH